MVFRVSILSLLLLPLAGCVSGAPTGNGSLTVPAAVIYHVDEDRWEVVVEQADEYPDEIRFETVLADGSRVSGLLPPERVFQPPTIRWKSPNGVVFEDERWVLWYSDRYVSLGTLGLKRQPLEASVWRRENVNDPNAPPLYAVRIKNTTKPFH